MARDVPSGSGDNSTFTNMTAVKELWNLWEIHSLILVSLFLQIFLYLTAGMRRHSTSRVLRTIIWLAYVSADSVAIFVLGNLAVHASEPRHQLMSFWAPFVLVHLGGQYTITGFSRQDMELWRRHMLNFVTQVGVAGYVVAKASWPDRRLKAAMVIMFHSGCFKYALRILCLRRGSAAGTKQGARHSLLSLTRQIKKQSSSEAASDRADEMRKTLDMMSKGSPIGLGDDHSISIDIMSVDAPLNRVLTILVADDLPGMLAEFLCRPDHYGAYEYVGAYLVHCYKRRYTSFSLQFILKGSYKKMFKEMEQEGVCTVVFAVFIISPILLYPVFHYISTAIALVLFSAAEKGDQHHTSRADVIVSYVLLIGALVQDVSSIIILIFSIVRSNLPAGISRVANYIWPARSKKLWSEELAQYNMIRRHTVQDTSAILPSIKQWIGRRSGDWGVGLLDSTATPITKEHTPIKEFILDNLLSFGARKEWTVASSRGQLALKKWMDTYNRQQVQAGPSPTEALEKSISNSVDFPTSLLIWHIATDICYHFGEETSTDSDQTKKHKQVSRELSNYIMYLVFKCGVMLTTNSEILHDKAHREISKILSSGQQHQQVRHLGEKEVAMKIFRAKKKKKQQDSTPQIQKHEEQDENNDAADSHLKKLAQGAQDLQSLMLPRAREVAQELISIDNETERWDLIAAVWLEMFYYTAPRCGSAFHSDHLTTGGEFATHAVLLMYFLGPFLPTNGE